MDYNTLASADTVAKTAEALNSHGFTPTILASGKEALETIKKLIPQGASVMNGSSTTLQQIGFVDYLKGGTHGWNNLHEAILAEKDPAKQAELRKHSVVSDYYLGSVHALTENGQLLIASNSGSQLPHLAYTSPNVILVVGTQKVTPTLEAGLDRIDTYVVPLEDERMRKAAGYGTAHNKTLILHAENPALKRTVTILLVNEKLGF